MAINLVTSIVLYVKQGLQLSIPMSSEGNNGDKDSYLVSSSPTLVTRYAQKSSKLIYSIEKNIFVVIAVVAALATISVIDAFEILGITDLIGENLDDTVIAVLSLTSLAAMIPILRLSYQSKKTLEDWAEMFERNSIKNSISMSLNSLDKKEVVYAIAETVEEISEPLSAYIEKGDFSEFFDVGIRNDVFDVLIDSETIKPEKSSSLARILADYGPIIAKIVDGKIGKKEVASFKDALSSYEANRRGKKNAPGLAMLVGRQISAEAYTMTKSNKGSTKNILLIEKP